ncbi:MAG: hypothetical protein Q4D05_03915 [Acinetobacter sp.]|nr:hypothetical protein [Acinetobacter sp.]
MPQVILTELARTEYLQAIQYFLHIGATQQASDLAQLFNDEFEKVATIQGLGKSYVFMVDTPLKNIKEHKFRYGKSGYQFLYYHDEHRDAVVILTLKNYRQQNYALIESTP